MGFECNKECPAYPVCFSTRLGTGCQKVLENFEKLGIFNGDSFVKPKLCRCKDKKDE